MIKERNYGIDLLRIVAMLMICLLHVISFGGVLPSIPEGSVNSAALNLLKVCTLCAVNCFALISGYAATDKPIKYSKIVNMWFQAFFYSFAVSLTLSLVGVGAPLGIKDLIRLALPVTFNQFWYFSSYVLLFFALPILNNYLFNLNKTSAQKLFFILIILCSILTLLTDPFITNYGYSPLWLMIMYCLGMLAKKIHLFEGRKTYVLIILFVLSTLFTLAFDMYNIHMFYSYVAPTIVFNALLLVVLFSRIRLKGTIISKISPLVFGVYLFQMSHVIWYELLQNRFAFIAEKPLPLCLLYVFFFAACIFISGLAIEFLRSKLAKVLRIHLLSEKIITWARYLFEKISVLTK